MKRLLTAVCLISMFACGQSAVAQDERPTLPNVQAPARNNNLNSFGGPGGLGMGPGVRQSPMQAAINELKQAESDKDKSAAKEKIKAELEKQYDTFLANDQTRVDQLFDRLKKLEEQLEKRKAAKERLVELKLEMMVSQAEGLGWPTDNGRNGNFFLPQPSSPRNPLVPNNQNQNRAANFGNPNSNRFVPGPEPRRNPPGFGDPTNNRLK